MSWQYNDGGREAAGFLGDSGDCVVRAIAIATSLPYKHVYDQINVLSKGERVSKRKRRKSSAREGVYRQTYQKYLESLGWKWTPTMNIGSGCKVHLDPKELPGGRLIVRVSKHMVAMIDGVVHDRYDPSREGNRCVYGFFIQPVETELKPTAEALAMVETRSNPELDDFMDDTEDKPAKKRRKKRVQVPSDVIKRRAFKVLAVISDLDRSQRHRVLQMAAKISKA